jgi:hypothetical protein
VIFFSHAAHGAIQRGGEQHGLTAFRRGLDDGFDVFDEAHVQHAVGFVQHQHFQAGEVNTARAHVVHQTARSGHDQVDRAGQGAGLVAEGGAANQAGGFHPAQVLAVFQGVLFHLLSQFAGRAQNQNARALALAGGALGQLGQRRQQEGGGLAATGLSGNQQVAAGNGSGDGFGLYAGGGV